MALGLGAWLACTIFGAFLIDLDYGPSLLSLAMHHGVTLLDAVGAALLVVGWSTAVATARRRAWPRCRTPGRLASTAVLLASCAGLVTAALLVPDFGGRKFVVGGFILLVEAAAAATVLAEPDPQ